MSDYFRYPPASPHVPLPLPSPEPLPEEWYRPTTPTPPRGLLPEQWNWLQRENREDFPDPYGTPAPRPQAQLSSYDPRSQPDYSHYFKVGPTVVCSPEQGCTLNEI